MPEAVIVSVARSPIGRAVKGSLASMRPDDLAVQMVRAALDKVPALDPREIDDLMLGCGQPGGEAGFNIGRADPRPMTEVAELICELLEKPTDLIQLADPGPLVTPVKNASFEKARTALGFEAAVPLREGITRTIAWHLATQP